MEKKIGVVNFFTDGEQQHIDKRKNYDFFTFETDLEEGDIVAVRTVNGLRFASFKKYIKVSSYAKAFIIAKIDERKIEKTFEDEAQAKQIKKELDARLLENEKMDKYKALADNGDERTKELLETLKTLEK